MSSCLTRIGVIVLSVGCGQLGEAEENLKSLTHPLYVDGRILSWSGIRTTALVRQAFTSSPGVVVPGGMSPENLQFEDPVPEELDAPGPLAFDPLHKASLS